MKNSSGFLLLAQCSGRKRKRYRGDEAKHKCSFSKNTRKYDTIHCAERYKTFANMHTKEVQRCRRKSRDAPSPRFALSCFVQVSELEAKQDFFETGPGLSFFLRLYTMADPCVGISLAFVRDYVWATHLRLGMPFARKHGIKCALGGRG